MRRIGEEEIRGGSSKTVYMYTNLLINLHFTRNIDKLFGFNDIFLILHLNPFNSCLVQINSPA